VDWSLATGDDGGVGSNCEPLSLLSDVDPAAGGSCRAVEVGSDAAGSVSGISPNGDWRNCFKRSWIGIGPRGALSTVAAWSSAVAELAVDELAVDELAVEGGGGSLPGDEASFQRYP
jgi:hypothetical protein